ncbi:proline--tRNA ligase [Aciditerrimonas ferrireducens]|uniref:Proline--tRNA ligase n=1 Tax=Aciditerrimonas ferrireducens TaxID=667306 RepID=A0ABV6C466_9ACTN
MAPPSVLTPRALDFPRWYQEVVAKAELAEGGPVRGTMVVRPYGYAIWERIQAELDRRIKALGAKNAYFPLLIPESFLRREAEHVEGFSPELAVVTHGGGKALEEPVVIRPTSETVINASFARWIQSHRDLPLMVNQWANVVRWELRPRLFLRTTEFLWHEAHTAHASAEEAAALARRVVRQVYQDLCEEILGIPVLVGRKTQRERFAGASATWTCEAMMGDGKALQMATSHELGQNFAKVFDITFSDESGERQLVWQTSWGASTRLMGALVMAHGDDAGLRLPPPVAPVQVVVLVARAGEGVAEAAHQLTQDLERAGVRAQLDDRPEPSFGRRVVDWELKGVPLRVELGPRDLAEGRAVVVRRDQAGKASLPLGQLAREVPALLDQVHQGLRAAAAEHLAGRTRRVEDLAGVLAAAREGFAAVPLDALGDEGEAALNAEGVTVRLVRRPDGQLPADEDPPAALEAVCARAY